MTVAYVGLGANLGDREARITRAAELIDARRLSTVIETEPWGYRDQPRFLNAVAEVETELDARELLDLLLDVERRLGASATGAGSAHGRSTSTSFSTAPRRSTSPG